MSYKISLPLKPQLPIMLTSLSRLIPLRMWPVFSFLSTSLLPVAKTMKMANKALGGVLPASRILATALESASPSPYQPLQGTKTPR